MVPRIRTVKPELFKHDDLFKAEIDYQLPLRLAFIALFTCSDREGRFCWKPNRLKLDLLPYDNVDIFQVLDALAARGFIVKYEHQGEWYGCIPSWRRHQWINNQREAVSAIPGMAEAVPLNAHASPIRTEFVSPAVSIAQSACASEPVIVAGNHVATRPLVNPIHPTAAHEIGTTVAAHQVATQPLVNPAHPAAPSATHQQNALTATTHYTAPEQPITGCAVPMLTDVQQPLNDAHNLQAATLSPQTTLPPQPLAPAIALPNNASAYHQPEPVSVALGIAEPQVQAETQPSPVNREQQHPALSKTQTAAMPAALAAVLERIAARLPTHQAQTALCSSGSVDTPEMPSDVTNSQALVHAPEITAAVTNGPVTPQGIQEHAVQTPIEHDKPQGCLQPAHEPALPEQTSVPLKMDLAPQEGTLIVYTAEMSRYDSVSSLLTSLTPKKPPTNLANACICAANACTCGREGNGMEEEGEGNITIVASEMRPSVGLPPNPDPVQRIFEHWKTVMKHPNAKLESKRTSLIRKALSFGYDIQAICQAITGCSLTPHNMGDNDRGQRYDGLHVILRDADQIDRFIYNEHTPPRPIRDADRQIQGNVYAVQRWMARKIQERRAYANG